MLVAARLPFSFDVRRMEADMRSIEAAGWAPHFNTQYYEGDWSGIPLRSNSRTGPLYVDPSRPDDFADLPALEQSAYIKEVLAMFQAPLRSVRYLKLAAGAVILEHRDFGLRKEEGEIRVHIPIRTNPGVEFVLGGETLTLLPGECWYLNLDLPHRVANRGSSERVHLVVDLVVNPWLDEIITRAECILQN
jgi:hypothetical protein